MSDCSLPKFSILVFIGPLTTDGTMPSLFESSPAILRLH